VGAGTKNPPPPPLFIFYINAGGSATGQSDSLTNMLAINDAPPSV